jgi:hypothetical protein
MINPPTFTGTGGPIFIKDDTTDGATLIQAYHLPTVLPLPNRR